MRKEDPQINENVERTAGNEHAIPVSSDREAGKGQLQSPQFTEVKNASASGLGTMGRNDEKLSEEQDKEEGGGSY